jgi:hypothetical protein
MEQCIANVSAAIDDAALLADGIAGEPSRNRWGSMAEHDAEQAVGEMVFKIHPRSLQEAFGRDWHLGDPGGADQDDDYRQFVKGKVWRSCRVVSEPMYGPEKCTRSWCLEPAEHLWMRLQHMEEVGNSILDINFEAANPFNETHAKFASQVFEPTQLGPLRAIFYQYELHGDSVYCVMVCECRRLSVSVDAQVRVNRSYNGCCKHDKIMVIRLIGKQTHAIFKRITQNMANQ